MLYRITGSNRDTGARMILELHAESKAAAERKALQQGMNVNHVLDITDGDPGLPPPAARGAGAYRGRSGSKLRRLVMVIVILAIVYAIWRYGIPRRPFLRSSSDAPSLAAIVPF
jgi:hypothetical protein